MTHSAQLTHAEFVAAYQSGRLQVHVDPKLAAKLVSGQMMLPIFLLPVFGLSVAVALMGHFIIGAVIFLAAFAFRLFVRRTAPGFILKRSLEDQAFYQHVVSAGVLGMLDEKQVVNRSGGV